MPIFTVKGRYVYVVECSGPTDEPGWEDEWAVDEHVDCQVTVTADSLEEAIAKGAVALRNKAKRNTDTLKRVEIEYIRERECGKIELDFLNVEELVKIFLSLPKGEDRLNLISSISEE